MTENPSNPENITPNVPNSSVNIIEELGLTAESKDASEYPIGKSQRMGSDCGNRYRSS